MPFLGTSQVDLVKWEYFATNSLAPTVATGVNSENLKIYGQDLTVGNISYDQVQNFFQSNQKWPTNESNGGVLDPTKYIQFVISANAGNQLNISNFKFECRMGGAAAKFAIKYSKDPNFVNNVYNLQTQVNLAANSGTNYTTFDLPFNQIINPVTSSEKVYVRFYIYDTYNFFELRHRNQDGTQSSPRITGTVCTPQGNQTDFGTNNWLGYTYILPADFSSSNNDFPTSNYIGLVTENSVNFDRNNSVSSPGGSTVNLCSSPQNNFSIRYKRNITLPAGNYVFTVGGDDGYRLSIDGGATWIINKWQAQSYGVSKTAPVCMDGTSKKFVIEYFESGGESRVSFDYALANPPTAPTSISGPSTICSAGETITLTAIGSTGANGDYRWGTGTPGTNIISGQNNATINVTPSGQITYWVQAKQCTSFSAAVSKTISVGTPGNPSVFGNNVWNVYGFQYQSFTPSAASYRGYYVQTTLGPNSQDITNNGWNQTLSPSSSQGWLGCSVPVNDFTFIHKRKGFTPGSYKLTVRNYDDKTEILVNGVSIKSYTSYYGGNAAYKDELGLFCFNENTTVEIRTTENAGDATFSMEIVPVESNYMNMAWENNANPQNTSAVVKTNLSLTQDLTICTCTVKDGVTLTVPSDKTLTVIGNVTIEGTGKIIIENNASFVQQNETASYIGASDSFLVKRYTQPVRRYDFTYWSSPVKDSDWKLNQLSPNTLSDKYYYYDPALGWKINYGGTMDMQTGRGYCVRAPQNFDINSQAVDVNTRFIGKPNNGNITFDAGAAGSYNLVGNPYAGAMSADEFINVNSANITGTVYFWTHNTANANNVYSPADYAAYNKVGGVATQAAASGGSKPTGKIASGQGFFVQRSASATNSLLFNNKMRVQGSNNQFYRPSPTEEDDTFYRNRFWINVSNANNAFSELLVGYITGATNSYDNGYDGETFGGNIISMYSLLNQTPLAIQGKSLPFENTDVIALGYTTNVAGQFTINLSDFDGSFTSQDIYLKDNSTGTITNLKEMNYEFTTATGTFDNRFEVQFLNEQENLGTENPILDASSVIIFANNSNQISIKSAMNISQVLVYDLQGRTLYSNMNVNSNAFSTQSLSVHNQVVLVKVVTDNKAELVKKVILQ